MIADIINGVFSLVLIYVAVLQDEFLHSTRGTLFEAVMGIAIVLLAFLARSSHEAWYTRIIMPLGAALVLFAVLADLVPLQLMLEHWFVFWIGVFTSVIAIWAALYPRNLEPQS